MTEQAIEAGELETLLAAFPAEARSLLPALRRVRQRYGYVPPAAIPTIARRLKLPPAQVYGVVTFYSELRTTPPPKLSLSWCSGPACRLRGGLRLRRILEALLEVELGHDAPDGRYGLHQGQCNGTCHLAPLLWLNGRALGPLRAADVVRLARELKENPLPGREGERGRGE